MTLYKVGPQRPEQNVSAITYQVQADTQPEHNHLTEEYQHGQYRQSK